MAQARAPTVTTSTGLVSEARTVTWLAAFSNDSLSSLLLLHIPIEGEDPSFAPDACSRRE
jgi:hypothetical protein